MPFDPVDKIVEELNQLPPEDQTDYLGNNLYEKVIAMCGEDLAPKITGMLLDMQQKDIIQLLRDPKALESKINEGMSLLHSNAWIPASWVRIDFS